MAQEQDEIEYILEQLLWQSYDGDVGNSSLNFSEEWLNTSYPLYDLFVYPSEMNIISLNFATVLSVCGILANLLSLVALMCIPGTFSCNQKIVFNLLLSNVFISVVLLCLVSGDRLFPTFLLGENYARKLCEHVVLKALVMMGHSVALSNLVILAFDHFMAINKPLQYMQFVKSGRVSAVLLVVWITSALFGFSDVLLPFPYYSYCRGTQRINFCEVGYCSVYEVEYLLFLLVAVCTVIMIYFYSRVFIKIYRYQKMAGRHQQRMKKNIKGLVTTLIILGMFIVCWLPHVIFEMYFIFLILVDQSAAMQKYQELLHLNYYLYWLWLVNCLCDPIIYAARMRDVKHGYRRLFRCYVKINVGDWYKKREPGSRVAPRTVSNDVTYGTVNFKFSSSWKISSL